MARNAFPDENLHRELKELDWDKKAYMRGKVKNKHARHNLCFGPESIEPDYENRQGRVYSWTEVPLLTRVRDLVVESGFLTRDTVFVEGNHYHDGKAYIGWHGDRERLNTAALRLGRSMWMQWQWYHRCKPIEGESLQLQLNHGDLYYMSAKAVGCDWRCSSIPTLRHCAGYTLR